MLHDVSGTEIFLKATGLHLIPWILIVFISNSHTQWIMCWVETVPTCCKTNVNVAHCELKTAENNNFILTSVQGCIILDIKLTHT